MAYQGRFSDLQRSCYTAAAESSGPGIPHRMEHPVRADGNWCCQDLAQPSLAGKKQESESLYRTAGSEFLLESDLLQCPGLRLCPCVAAASVEPCPGNDPAIPANRFSGSQAAAPLFDLVDLRCLSEPGRMVPEPVTKVGMQMHADFLLSSFWITI